MQEVKRFRSFGQTIRPRVAPETFELSPPENPPPKDEVEVARALRLFKAHVTEAVQRATRTLCEDIAADIVSRELQLAPADIVGVVDSAIQRYFEGTVVRIRLHPDDASNAAIDLPFVADSALRRGDAILELRDGFVDLTLGARLDSILAAQ